MKNLNYINQEISILIILSLSFLFICIGIFYSRKFRGINNYLIANRSVGTFSLTTSFIASALGTWILFGPASAATWGGIGAVIGYSLGTAFPLFILIFLGSKFRKFYPNCITLIEVIRLKYGRNLYKLILILSIFYMTIFLIAEVTAVAMLINYISGTSLWITSLIILSSSLIYTLYGGLRASIFTDNLQFILFLILLILSFSYLITFNKYEFNLNFIYENKPLLLSAKYLPNFTAGLTFFIAVAATNLFHQGNWQRVYSAKNDQTLKRSLFFSFLIIIPIVFFMGFCGLVAVSANKNVVPDLAFFDLLLKDQYISISFVVIVLGISLTISSIDTLINAIISLVIVDGKKMLKVSNTLKISNVVIIILCLITFYVASKGYSILYLFLIADLLCCAAVLSVFYGFYNKTFLELNAYVSIIIGLVLGILLFPSPDFSKSLLVGILFPKDFFPEILSQSLLFFSFLAATLTPILTWKLK